MCSSCEVIKTESTAKRPLSLTHPHLMDEWDFVKNGEVRPEYLTAGSNKKVHWYHRAEDGQIHVWRAAIDSRARAKGCRGCPYCSNRAIGYGNDLKTKHPRLCEEQWDKIKNVVLPEECFPCSHRKAWWVCSEGHSWEAPICDRTRQDRPSGCSYCTKKKAGYGNDLLSLFPELCEKEWNFSRNKKGPEKYLPCSNKKVWWWHLDENGVLHEWEASIWSRTKENKPTGCPYCSGNKVGYGNDLVSKFPEIALEWDKEKNGDLRPEHVTYGSNTRVHWKCGKGHCWVTTVRHRTAPVGTKCPYCHSRKLGYGNDLLTNYPELCEEWDHEKNKKGPDKYFTKSNSKVHWKHTTIRGEVHEWSAYICNRTANIESTGCPICNKGNVVSRPARQWLGGLGLPDILSVTREVTLRVRGRSPIVDGFNPDTNTIYEFLGDFWHGNPDIYNPNDINKKVGKSFKRLHKETMERLMLLKEAGYKVAYIWESDFQKGLDFQYL